MEHPIHHTLIPYRNQPVFFFEFCFLKITVRDPKVSHFFRKKTFEKWDTLGTFTQKGTNFVKKIYIIFSPHHG